MEGMLTLTAPPYTRNPRRSRGIDVKDSSISHDSTAPAKHSEGPSLVDISLWRKPLLTSWVMLLDPPSMPPNMKFMNNTERVIHRL